MNQPFVSIIVPTLNEERFIGDCLRSLLKQDYPDDCIEILVSDGRSNDKTREVVAEIAQEHACIQIVDNPQRVTPCALNTAIGVAKGSVIVRMDAHCEYPNDYVSRCVQLLQETGADNVGAGLITLPGAETTMAHAIVYAQTSRFGMGGARYRMESGKPGYVDTVPFGAYRREVFDRIGLFDEELLRNQDNEFNSRIIANGGKIYFDPSIRLKYFSRPTLKGFLRMLWKNGLYHWLVLRKNPKAFRLRHMAPSFFLLVLLTALTGGFFWKPLWLFGGLVLATYLAGATAATLQIAVQHGPKYLFVMPCVFFLSHICYGLSTWLGLFKFVVFGGHGRSGQGLQAGR